MTAHLTTWVILGFFVAIVAYDVVALILGGVQATISRVTIAAIGRWPIIGCLLGLAVGVLLGHLVWWQPQPGCACP